MGSAVSAAQFQREVFELLLFLIPVNRVAPRPNISFSDTSSDVSRTGIIIKAFLEI